MSNILLCDANFCVLPIVASIMTKKNILTVVGVLDSDPAHNIAHHSVNIDYSDVPVLKEHISEVNYDYIIPGCNDRSYISLAKIAEELNYSGFDNYETTLIIHLKDRFRTFARSRGYPIPKFVYDVSCIGELNFPILIKPIDSFSGKGTNKANKIESVEEYWKEALEFSKSGKVIAEEFIEGKLYSHSAFIKNKKIIGDFFVNEYCTVYPYQVNSSNISTKLSLGVQQQLKRWVEQFAQDLDLVDGLIHTQFISDNESFFLIEVTRRCPGDLYSKLIQMSTGMNYSELYSLPFIGEELPDKIEKKEQSFISRHTVSVEQDCIFISSRVELKNVKVQNVQLKYSGQLMKAAPFDKSGIYFIEFNNAEEMEDATSNLKDYVSIEKLDIK